ncbi:MAG: hypothetical protein MHMPM18_002825 [Marteilia pararefringens]
MDDRRAAMIQRMEARRRSQRNTSKQPAIKRISHKQQQLRILDERLDKLNKSCDCDFANREFSKQFEEDLNESINFTNENWQLFAVRDRRRIQEILDKLRNKLSFSVDHKLQLNSINFDADRKILPPLITHVETSKDLETLQEFVVNDSRNESINLVDLNITTTSSIIIINCQNCQFYFPNYAMEQIKIENCQNCVFYSPISNSSLYIETCKDCRWMKAECRQLRVKNSEQCCLQLFVSSKAVIESSSDLNFQETPKTSRELSTDDEQETNRLNEIEDFSNPLGLLPLNFQMI